jgi:hypothetical protein
MCTVTFWSSRKGFTITSNRDEHASRNARKLHKVVSKTGVEVYFPQDELRGGSWFAATDDGRVGCILNGAFEPYDVSQEWPESRGRMLLNYFDFADKEKFAGSYDFEKVAPFTFVVFDVELEEWKFDGKNLYRRSLDQKEKHIWSSVTLYPKPVRQARVSAFRSFQEMFADPDPVHLMDFHSSQPFGDGTNDFVMDRNGKVQTVSITQFTTVVKPEQIHHKDLISGTDTKLVLEN